MVKKLDHKNIILIKIVMIEEKSDPLDEYPPILKTWNNLYTAVLVLHIIVILIFTYITYIYK